MNRLVLIVSLAAAALTLAALPAPADAASPNHALQMRWPAYVDTEVPFSDFFSGSHTIVARVLLQYPYANAGPIVTGSNGSGAFELGQGNYDDAPESDKLVLTVGGKTARYVTFSDILAGKHWVHLALVRRNKYSLSGYQGTAFELYVNGMRLCVSGGATCDLEFPPGSTPAVPNGSLRIGRTEASQAGVKQLYGLVDDVAVFSKALSGEAIQAIKSAKRLTGDEPGLYTGFTFDDATPSGGLLPRRLAGAVHYEQGATRASVSQIRDDADVSAFPLPHPFYAPALKLPFKAGQVWRVSQGYATTGSHDGTAAFSLDFALVGPESDGKEDNPAIDPDGESCGEPVLAAAPGDVIWTHDTGGFGQWADGENNDFDGNNVVFVKHDGLSYSYATYMHTFTGSIADAFPSYWSLYGVLPPSGPAIHVNAGKQVATVGTRNGCHLHWGVGNSTNAYDMDPVNIDPPQPYANYPVAFWNYKACDAHKGKDCGKPENWYSVAYGVPEDEQHVKNP